MKKILIMFCFVFAFVFFASIVNAQAKGFDEFGYNYSARIFNGLADGIDKNLDKNIWGDSIYANDKVVMKWNEEWDRGKLENWSKSPYAAWEDNEWNGNVAGGTGEVWHYKIKWVGSCGADGTELPDGGYCIWGQFETILDHGMDNGTHSWLTHAISTGYGK